MSWLQAAERVKYHIDHILEDDEPDLAGLAVLASDLEGKEAPNVEGH